MAATAGDVDTARARLDWILRRWPVSARVCRESLLELRELLGGPTAREPMRLAVRPPRELVAPSGILEWVRTEKIRTWAKTRGYPVRDRGPLPVEVLAAFERALVRGDVPWR